MKESDTHRRKGSPGTSVPEGLSEDTLSFVRHELRTPINAILGYGEMLMEDLEDEPGHPLASGLRDLHKATKKILKEINLQLDPSRLTSGLIRVTGFQTSINQLQPQADSISRIADRLAEITTEDERDIMQPDLHRIREAAIQLADMLKALADPSRAALEQTFMRPSSESFTDSDAGAAQQAPHAPCSPGTILVVDDNDANRDVLGRYLTRQGHRVEFAVNGREALQKVAAGSHDLILLDILMPEMDGRAVLRRLRESQLLKDTPVIVISAMDDIQAVAECIRLGAEDCLRKPFDPVLLRARVRAGLEKKRLRERERAYLEEIKLSKQKADRLLHLLYPAKIVEELKSTGRVRPRLYQHVAVFFADLVGFTAYCQEEGPEAVLNKLQVVDDAFEELTLDHGLEKIKTIGDAFMAASGLVRETDEPVLECVRCGLAFVDRLANSELPWQVRVGIHAGPLIAGVVGRRKCLFDVWGATVNTAARVESNGDPGSVNLSATAWNEVRSVCEGRSLGERRMKGIGNLEIYKVNSLR